MSGPRRRRSPAAFPPWEPAPGEGPRRPLPRQPRRDAGMRSDQESLDLFRVYLDDIGRYPLLTKEDEIELSQAYEAGLDAQLKLADTSPDDPARPDLEVVADHGDWARRKMIESNLRPVSYT